MKAFKVLMFLSIPLWLPVAVAVVVECVEFDTDYPPQYDYAMSDDE